MIFGYTVVIACIVLYALDYSYLFKDHKTAFLCETLIWGALSYFFYKPLVLDAAVYDNGGIKVDILTFFLLSREAILARIARSKSNRAITQVVRERALENVRTVPLKSLSS